MATSVRLLLACIVPLVASLILPMTQSNGNPDIVSIINHVALMEQQMDALQKQVLTSNMNINTLTTELKYANEKISSLEKQVNLLTHDQGRVEAVTKNPSTTSTSSIADECKMDIEALRTSAEANFTRLHGLIQENQNMLVNTSTVDSVAFQAVLNQTTVTVENKEILKFDIIPMNLGGAYNKYNGIFTVPVPGVYMFWANILVDVAGRFQILLVKNGAEVVKGYTGSTHFISYVSLLYVSEFQKGDTVAFQNSQCDDKTVLEGGTYSSYGGIRLG